LIGKQFELRKIAKLFLFLQTARELLKCYTKQHLISPPKLYQHTNTHTHTHTGVESVFDIVDMEDENRNALLQLTDAQIQVSKIVIRPLGQTKL